MTEMAPLTPLFSDQSNTETPPSAAPEDGNEKLAQDFVRWCFGFGPEFRNSPDVTNLRFWTAKKKLDLSERVEASVHRIALKLYAKKLDQALKQPEPTAESSPGDPPADFQLTAG